MLRIEEIVGAMDDEFRYALDALSDERLAVLAADKAALRRLRPIGVSTAEAQAMIAAIQDRRRRQAEQAARKAAQQAARKVARAAKPRAPRKRKAEAVSPAIIPVEVTPAVAEAVPTTSILRPPALPPRPAFAALPQPQAGGPAIRLGPPASPGPVIILGPPPPPLPPSTPTAPPPVPAVAPIPVLPVTTAAPAARPTSRSARRDSILLVVLICLLLFILCLV